MFDVNHAFAFTVHASARIPAAQDAGRSRGETPSEWLQRVMKMIKAHSSPPGDCHLLPAGDKLQCARWQTHKKVFCTYRVSPSG